MVSFNASTTKLHHDCGRMMTPAVCWCFCCRPFPKTDTPPINKCQHISFSPCPHACLANALFAKSLCNPFLDLLVRLPSLALSLSLAFSLGCTSKSKRRTPGLTPLRVPASLHSAEEGQRCGARLAAQARNRTASLQGRRGLQAALVSKRRAVKVR